MDLRITSGGKNQGDDGIGAGANEPSEKSRTGESVGRLTPFSSGGPETGETAKNPYRPRPEGEQ
jgi:hypothetical protein